jgi:hypothetical protein
MANPSILDTLIYGYRTILGAGVEKTNRSQLNFASGFDVVDNEDTGATDVSVAEGAGGGSFAGRLVTSVDFTTMTTQAITGNGNVTIGGVQWTMDNFSKLTSAGVVNGTGLQMVHGTSSSDYVSTTRTAAVLHARITSFLPTWSLYNFNRFRLWAHFTHNATHDGDFIKFGVERRDSPSDLNATMARGKNTNQLWGFIGADDTANVSDDVAVFDWYHPAMFLARSGTYGADYPDPDSLNEHNIGNIVDISGTGAKIPWTNGLGASNVDVCFVCQETNTSGGFTATLKRLRLEAW